MSPISMSIDGQFLTPDELNPEEHQIIFRRMGEFGADVNFHYVHIPIPLNKINQVSDKAIEKIKACASNVYQESIDALSKR